MNSHTNSTDQDLEDKDMNEKKTSLWKDTR